MSIRNFISPAHPDALAVLREDGVFRVPDYLSAGEVAMLHEEFEGIFSGNQAGGRPIDFFLGHGAVCQPDKLGRARYPALLAVLLAEAFRELASAYFSTVMSLRSRTWSAPGTIQMISTTT